MSAVLCWSQVDQLAQILAAQTVLLDTLSFDQIDGLQDLLVALFRIVGQLFQAIELKEKKKMVRPCRWTPGCELNRDWLTVKGKMMPSYRSELLGSQLRIASTFSNANGT